LRIGPSLQIGPFAERDADTAYWRAYQGQLRPLPDFRRDLVSESRKFLTQAWFASDLAAA